LGGDRFVRAPRIKSAEKGGRKGKNTRALVEARLPGVGRGRSEFFPVTKGKGESGGYKGIRLRLGRYAGREAGVGGHCRHKCLRDGLLGGRKKVTESPVAQKDDCYRRRTLAGEQKKTGVCPG